MFLTHHYDTMQVSNKLITEPMIAFSNPDLFVYIQKRNPSGTSGNSIHTKCLYVTVPKWRSIGQDMQMSNAKKGHIIMSYPRYDDLNKQPVFNNSHPNNLVKYLLIITKTKKGLNIHVGTRFKQKNSNNTLKHQKELCKSL